MFSEPALFDSAVCLFFPLSLHSKDCMDIVYYYLTVHLSLLAMRTRLRKACRLDSAAYLFRFSIQAEQDCKNKMDYIYIFFMLPIKRCAMSSVLRSIPTGEDRLHPVMYEE